MSKIRIAKGEDRVIPVEVIRKGNDSVRRPFDLTGFTKITVEFKKSNNTILSIDDVAAFGRFSTFLYEGVTYTADTIGVVGDTINIIFTGSNTIADAITTWNASNPSNTVSSDAADDTVVPTANNFLLTGGLNNFKKVNVTNDLLGLISVQLDNVDTNSLVTGTSQNIRVIIDFGANDLGNRRIAIAKNVLDVISDPL